MQQITHAVYSPTVAQECQARGWRPL